MKRNCRSVTETGMDVVLDDLPENCVFDILVRLPLETLCSSRFVCKSWFEIISSPEFRNAHLHRSDTARRGLIFLTRVENQNHSSPPKKVFSVESSSMLFDLLLSTHMKFMEIKDGKSTMTKMYNAPFKGKIVATCNGLIVLKNNPGTRLVLLNPVTRELEDIPLGTTSSSLTPDSYGLAFCHVSRRYKLLRLFMKDKLRNLGCEIMDIGSGSWRALDVPPTKSIYFLNNLIFAMGALHWIQYVVDHGECMVSMSLDDEKFKTMAFPDTDGDHFHYNSVFAMGEFVGYASRRYQKVVNHQIGVWVLRGLGGECGWEKQYNIDVASDQLGYNMTTLLYYGGGVNGYEFIFNCGDGCLYAYDDRRHMRKIEDIDDVADTHYSRVFPHVNSLVSWRALTR